MCVFLLFSIVPVIAIPVADVRRPALNGSPVAMSDLLLLDMLNGPVHASPCVARLRGHRVCCFLEEVADGARLQNGQHVEVAAGHCAQSGSACC